ncbi:AAA family ATPase [Photobacterium alginatilyticum]|uniref:ATPase n=1 Tax=Photobacterium alginatilyticum TaxID=1775171 RepID=A0ABW9YNU8_9GAMM|nr:AAA family ATPase [Photobacterium alginatilyticum]NBI55552.1 ATPase [Photobacterium alginatilyticum]
MSIESVVGWANNLKRNLWWRHALRLAAEKGELGGDDLRLLLNVAKMECGLEERDESFESYIAPLVLTGFGEEKYAVKLTSISHVNNVSALVSNASLQFQDEGLTAVYGDNGSGKSSYAKILKNACLTRGSTPRILPNIYSDQTGTASAEIAITIVDSRQNIAWESTDAPHEDLKAIRIFDNTSAAHYISDEDSIDYKPAGMKLLSQLMRTCEFVRSESEREKRPYLEANPLPKFKPGGCALALVSSLSDKTEQQAIDAICLSKEEEKSIPVLKEELIKLKTSTPEQLRKSYRDNYKELQPLFGHINKLKGKLGQERFDAIKSAYDDFKTKQGAAEIARKQAIEGSDISGICSPEWRVMWAHVQKFVQAHNFALAFPPAEGEPCPTCLQPISEESAEKLKSFNDYLQDKTQIEANKAKRIFDTYIADLKRLSFDLKPYEFILGKIGDFKKEIADGIKELNSSFEIIRNNLIKEEPDFSQIKVEFNALEWIGGQIVSLKLKEESVKTNADLEKQVAELTNKIEELEERKIFTASKQNVLKEIERLKMVALFGALTQTCQSGTITTQTSAIAKIGAIGNIEEAFHAELQKLGFRNFNVSTETRGSRGKQMLRFSLTDKTNGIVDVASEGEQKCVALAGFLAELTVDERKSAIIFDDPINSLDHKWRRKFAERIAEEALHRQVILFTHDMPFLIMLEEATNRAKSKYNAISIAKRGKLSGYPMAEPPWDVKSTADRVKELNLIMPELKSHEDNDEVEAYEHMARFTYNRMRETWERLVEEWLLKKVVERFGRGVKTQSLRDVVHKGGITAEDYDTIDAGMSKCSTFMYGHDQAPELSDGVPNYAEVQGDLDALKEYFKQLKKRRS